MQRSLGSEKIKMSAKKIPKKQTQELYRYITAIYEACIFQDPTDQRLTTKGRIVKILINHYSVSKAFTNRLSTFFFI